MAVSSDQHQQPPPPPPPPAGGGAAGSSSPSPRPRVHDTTLVPPSPSPPETSLPLTFFDVFWLHSPPVERLFVYRLAPDADADAVISGLRSSLRHAVRAFFPLAGRVRLTPGTSDRHELHYRPGDGVAFTVAECDDGDDAYARVDALVTDEPREVAKIAALVPPLPEGGGVFAVQATLLPARRGLAVGVTVHHAACDGAGSTHFLHTWAAACRGGGGHGGAADAPPPPPVIDRSLVPDPNRLYDAFVQGEGAPSTEEYEFVKMAGDQMFATFTLSRDELQRVKDAVADEAARRGVAPPPRCSSLVATFGLVWSCYQRAKEASGGGGGAGETCMGFSVDHRSRMKPHPLPEKYFGNCVGPALALAPTGELGAGGAGGLFSACAAVAASIDEAVRDMGTPKAWMDRIREVVPMGLLTVAGSPRFRVYDVDFGFGRPAKVDIVSVARTGAVAVAESRGGDGGMEVGVSLRPAAMERYRKSFADAVAWLNLRS